MGPDVRTRAAAGGVLVIVFLVGLAMDGPLVRASAPGGPDSATAPAAGTLTTVEAGSRTEAKVLKRIDLTARQRSTVDSTRAAIQGVLDPDQAILYDSLLVENDRRRGRPGSDSR